MHAAPALLRTARRCMQPYAAVRGGAYALARLPRNDTISRKCFPTIRRARSYPYQKGNPLLTNEDIAAIYRRHVRTVYRLCFSFLKTTADAEDAVQSVFMKLIRSDKQFESAEHEKAWLIVCASNHCRDVLKSAARSKAGVMPDDVADERASDCFDETLEAVLALPAKYKDCVYLHYYEGYKTDEIARMTGRTPSTVRSHLSEARALLKSTLGGDSHDR